MDVIIAIMKAVIVNVAVKRMNKWLDRLFVKQ